MLVPGKWFHTNRYTIGIRNCRLLMVHIALKVLVQLSSASCCERNWSTTRVFATWEESNWHHNLLDDLVFIHSNVNLLQGVAYNICKDNQRCEILHEMPLISLRMLVCYRLQISRLLYLKRRFWLRYWHMMEVLVVKLKVTTQMILGLMIDERMFIPLSYWEKEIVYICIRCFMWCRHWRSAPS